MLRILFLGLAFVLTACGSETNQDSVIGVSSAVLSSSSSIMSEVSSESNSSACNPYSAEDAASDLISLEEGRALWDSLSLKSYQYTYALTSNRFPPIDYPPMIVSVSEGAISEVYTSGTGEYIDPNEYPMYEIKTIDEWFDEAENMINDSTGSALNIRFNQDYGFPESINVDIAPCGGSDGQSTYTLSDFN